MNYGLDVRPGPPRNQQHPPDCTLSRPVTTGAMERLMDCAAARLGLDPVEIRCRNLIAEFRHTSVTGVVHDRGSYRGAM